MKRIEINPELFNMKTKKKREPIQRPIISPNILKNKLLSRIKAHKKHEIKNPSLESSSSSSDTPKLVDTNEFDDSMSFFNLLSRKADLHKKTLKKSSVLEDTPYVNLDLPPDLTKPVYQAPPIQLKVPPNQPPYSNLKNGSRPTYREWNKTMRNYSNTPVESAPISVRENKLNELRERIKQKHQNVNTHVSQTNQLAADVYSIISQPVSNPIQISNPIEQIENKVIESVIPDNEKQKINLDLVNINTNNINQQNTQGRVISQTIKKTIKRKYTLGKSANNRSVAVLLKDVNSRKNVLKAHRDLKKKSIGDVKQYLRDHNLIRVGSNAPSDVLRKLYESAMMSGEITNNNQDTLLNNLLKEQKIV